MTLTSRDCRPEIDYLEGAIIAPVVTGSTRRARAALLS